MALLAVVFGAACVGIADTHYVWKGNPAPVPPFTNGWASAATQIQDAVSVAANGDLVLVTNGVYNTGGAKYNNLTNRVCIVSKSIAVQAVSSNPADTLIVGAIDPGTGSNGPAAVRGVGIYDYISSSVSGFTITNSYTYTTSASANDQDGGGVFVQFHRPPNGYGSYFTNCVIVNCHGLNGGGSYAGNYINCVIINNTADRNGGGAMSAFSVFSNSVFSGNISDSRGAGYGGGGIYGGDVYNSEIMRNRSYKGGGIANAGSVINCIISDNTITGNGPVNAAGGGILNATLIQNCLIVKNSAPLSWGAVSGSVMINCTIVSNTSAAGYGAIVPLAGVFLTNCIVYGNWPYNLDPLRPDLYTYWVNYSCVPTSSPACTIIWDHSITSDPMFADFAGGNYRLASHSPCFNSGINQNWMTNAVDLDGKERINNGRVDMGAFEYWRPRGTIITILGTPVQ